MFRSSKPKQQDSPEEEEEDEEAVEIHVQNDVAEDSDKQKKKKKTRKYFHIPLKCCGFSIMSFAAPLLDFKQKISWRIGLHQR